MSGKNLTILVVDDSLMNKEMLKEMFKDVYNFYEASNGIEALKIYEKHRKEIDIILLDIVMPVMDGFGFLEIMNERKWIEDVPVVVLTSDLSRDSLSRAYELGVIDYCVRPIDEEIVSKKIHNALLTYRRKNIDLEDVLHILNKSYYCIVKVNLTDNRVSAIAGNNLGMHLISSSDLSYTEWIGKICSEYVHENDRAGFLAFTDIRSVRNRMSNGEEKFNYPYRMFIKGEAVWVSLTVNTSIEYGRENQVAVMFFENIDSEYKKQIEAERRINSAITGFKVKRNVLIVDDEKINRMILTSMLQEDYSVAVAENGQEAYTYLQKHGDETDLILLDLIMPVMDGYSLLKLLQNDPFLKAIPVIVGTGATRSDEEIECLRSGASDFIVKPYNKEIVLSRISTILRLKENSTMVDALKRDPLTGIYSYQYFYHVAGQVILSNENTEFDFVCCHIENYKMIVERFGMQKGNEVVKFVAEQLGEFMKRRRIVYGRMSTDLFGILIPHGGNITKFIEFAVNSKGYQKLLAEIVPGVVMKFGIYENVDKSVPVQVMCDRARTAVGEISGKYRQIIARYDDSTRLRMLMEEKIQNTCEKALEEGQFKVWFQPKHNIKTGKLEGAEALVRWEHPEYGFMSPGQFIPLFEKNGFITILDKYVWNKTCEMMAGWRKSGMRDIPVSVNISRIDFCVRGLDEYILDVADKYGIPHELLHLEITESAYTENPVGMIETVKKFREKGFKVEMDDFGTGYSSLNMFSELSVDILKLDMKLVQQIFTESGRRILKLIIEMALALGLSVTAEGVETKEQLDALAEIECDQAQGYYFSKPVPCNEFELYMKIKY